MKPDHGTLHDQMARIRPKIQQTKVTVSSDQDDDLEPEGVHTTDPSNNPAKEQGSPTTKRAAEPGEPYYVDNEGTKMFDNRQRNKAFTLKIALPDGRTLEVPVNQELSEQVAKEALADMVEARRNRSAERFNMWAHSLLQVAGAVALGLGIFFGAKKEISGKDD